LNNNTHASSPIPSFEKFKSVYSAIRLDHKDPPFFGFVFFSEIVAAAIVVSTPRFGE